MQVVEHEQRRRELRLRFEPARDRFEQQVALGLGIARRRGDARHAQRDLGNEAAQLTSRGAEQRSQLVVGRVTHDVGERFDERLVRNAESSSQRPSKTKPPSRSTSRPSSAARRVLPIPGSPATRTARRVPVDASFQAVVTSWSSSSRPASEKRGAIENAVGKGKVHRPHGERCPFDFARGDGIGQALEGKFADGAQRHFHATAEQDAHDVGDKHLARGGGGTEARRFDDWRPEPVVVLERGFSDRDPDAQREREATSAAEHVDLLLHAARGADRVGITRERDHEPVAEVLHLRATMRHDLGSQHVEDVAPQPIGGRVTDSGVERGRFHEIAEQHRDRCGQWFTHD